MGSGCRVWAKPKGDCVVDEAEAGEEGPRSRECRRPQLLPLPLERASGTTGLLFASYLCGYIDTHSLP